VTIEVNVAGLLVDPGTDVGVGTRFGAGSRTTDSALAEILGAAAPEWVAVWPWSSNVSVVRTAILAMEVTVCPSVC
jgi:ABC-type glucose/galactose transport system permease subunit